MENFSGPSRRDEEMDLPPGFRFHPTDEELITHYLAKKVVDSSFDAVAIGFVDLNKCEPWDLPWQAKMGEKEWYFFCVRDRKYPTGLRTNRATEAGYWKATGKDKDIYREKVLVGMKKTLVFYKGRAPKGEKTNWVMHEYRLEGKYSLFNLPKTAKNEWVICRIFKKGSGGKKIPVSGLMRISSFGDDLVTSLPPLMDPHPYNSEAHPLAADNLNVTCFSVAMEGYNNCFSNPSDISPASLLLHGTSVPNSIYFTQGASSLGNLQYPGAVMMQDQDILRAALGSHGLKMKHNCKGEREMGSVSQETGLTTEMNNEISSVVSNHEMGRRPFEDLEGPSSSVGPVDLDCLWSF